MFDKLKAFGAWAWNWVTVIASILVGLPAAIFELLDAFDITDLTPLMPTEYATRIIAFVAIAKMIYALATMKKA